MKYKATNPSRSILVADLLSVPSGITKTMLTELGPTIDRAMGKESLMFAWCNARSVAPTIKLMESWGYSSVVQAFTFLELHPDAGAIFNKATKSSIKVDVSEIEGILLNVFKFNRTTGLPKFTTNVVLMGRKGKEPFYVMRRTVKDLVIGGKYERTRLVNQRIEKWVQRPQDRVFELFSTDSGYSENWGRLSSQASYEQIKNQFNTLQEIHYFV